MATRPQMDIESLDASHESTLRSHDGRVVAVVELLGGVSQPGLSRERQGDPRDGRVRASTEPTAELSVSSLDSGDLPNKENPLSASGHRRVPPVVDYEEDSSAVGNDPAGRARNRSQAAAGSSGARCRGAGAQVNKEV